MSADKKVLFINNFNNKNCNVSSESKESVKKEENTVNIDVFGNGCEIGNSYIFDADSFNYFNLAHAKSLDINGDNRISEEEFSAIYNDSMFDIDKDGKISDKETRIKNSHRKMLESQFQFAKMDLDKDGQISAEEEALYFEKNKQNKVLSKNGEKHSTIFLTEGSGLEVSGHSVDVEDLVILKKRNSQVKMGAHVSGNGSLMGETIYVVKDTKEAEGLENTPVVTGNSSKKGGFYLVRFDFGDILKGFLDWMNPSLSSVLYA